MAFRATLSFAGKEFDVLDCRTVSSEMWIPKDAHLQTFMVDKFVCMWNRLMILPFWRT